MKTKTISYLLSIVTLALAWSATLSLPASTVVEPWYQPSKQHEDSQYDDATLNKIQTLKVSVRWNNISVKAALDDLASQSQQADPRHQGIKFILTAPSDTQKVNVDITDGSLLNVLGYLTEQSGLRIKIHKGEVILLPLKETTGK